MHMEEPPFIQFEWDDRKALSNEHKHGVAFAEAVEAFYDPHARLIDDPDHSTEEERFILLGLSLSARVMTVSHCVRQQGTVIRILSARRATRNEENQYWRLRK
ncbi:uncharacterized DUF497 family protein [Trueperella bonasi]|uniref:Uncharacterized DUF497 family protein n=1 Tax=Trueperella bonasi TaxID=312286 RepID=A0ABT9NFL5_9ACTO|nr:uncharacterized DUF497 family protein [Trueperella bonasi]